jgi:hypothetical protein
MDGIGGVPAPLPPLVIQPNARITLGIDSITIGYNVSGGVTDTTFGMWIPLQTSMTAAFVAAGKTPPTFNNQGLVGQPTAAWLANINTQVIATNPTDLLLIMGINDVTGLITPAAVKANCVSAFSTIISSFPSVNIHVFGTQIFNSEVWPDGSLAGGGGSLAAAAQACNSAIYAAVAQFPANCRWYNMRQMQYNWEAANNGTPATAVSQGLLTQDGGHPSKIGQRPAGQSGQEVGSAWAMTVLTLGLT